jgi:aspartyl-tRNA(Asn)/glutamyl-tRNA(Gln) amidotransferase subunit C
MLTRDAVQAIAQLAHLTLTEEELQMFGRQLADILDWIDEVQQADTRDVPPTSHPLAADTAWREDEPRPSADRGDVLDGAPDADRTAGLFRVPKVL